MIDYFRLLYHFDEENVRYSLGSVKKNTMRQYDYSCNQVKMYYGFPSLFFAEFKQTAETIFGIIGKLNINAPYIRSLKDRYELVATLAANKEECEGRFKDLISQYRKGKGQIMAKIGKLSEEEKARLNEAIHTLKHDCCHSSIVMCAVAIENRLYEVLKKVNSNALKRLAQKKRCTPEKATLGTLINIYLENKDEFCRIVPPEHEKPLELLNKYRIFSAHPKKVELKVKSANVILNLTLAFLLDDRLCIGSPIYCSGEEKR